LKDGETIDDVFGRM